MRDAIKEVQSRFSIVKNFFNSVILYDSPRDVALLAEHIERLEDAISGLRAEHEARARLFRKALRLLSGED